MLKGILKNKNQIAIIGILVTLLIAIRFFEETIFYDPFLDFFKTDFQNKSLPEYDSTRLFLSLFIRYFLNTFCSLGILYFLFKDKNIIQLSTLLLVVFFLILITLFAFELKYTNDYMLLFYTRRFLIQPLFLILFIPAFYYQRLNR